MDDQFGSPAGEQPRSNRNMIIIGVVIAVLLCCCCVTIVGGWFYGDQILQALGISF